ncbi:MAG TPA: glycoside hydrolase family 9 protein [Pseudobacteroides sp.]|uniref:glycoside hydrolase family 9 protein n=1 Tax=Pseudobacteroides sp. TaxID=1968840 RepID=UPI002F92A245
MRKILSCLLIVSVLTGFIVPSVSFSAAGGFDYAAAFKDSILFFDANKCGKDVAGDNHFSGWRGACHIEDGKDVGVDLTGGFHDAGDHVKFGLPQGYAAAILGWSLFEYRDVFDSTGNTQKMLSTLKYFTDYFLKSHPDAITFYYQLGEGEEDHKYWDAPEKQTYNRPTYYVADASHTASDVLGMTSAALTIMYLNYKGTDSVYADKCLKAAKELYVMGTSNPGYGSGQSFYMSNSYYDDLAFAAAWLYQITKDEKYLQDSQNFIKNRNRKQEDPLQHKWTICWDDMYLAVFTKLSELTGNETYKNAVEYNLNYWKTGIKTSPGGMKYLDNWGALRYASAASLLAMLYYKQSKDESLKTLAKSQIDYILGDNPANMSYVIGFGSKYPTHPHHRAANGYTYAGGENSKPAKHLLTGALVGGPDATDKYIDDVNQFQYTEVAIDYNAGFVGAMAAVTKYYGGAIVSNPPSSTPTTKPTPANGYKVSGFIAHDLTSTVSKSGFNIQIVGTQLSAQTDNTGYFEISGVSAGSSYSLKVSKAGYLSREIGSLTVTKDTQVSAVNAPIYMWAGDIPVDGISDGAINMKDVIEIGKCFNATSSDPKYILSRDLNQDNSINMSDIVIIAKHFGKTSADYN